MITFPAGALEFAPVRIPIVGRGEGWLALDKPPDIAFGSDDLAPSAPDLQAALQAALEAGKPQLAALGIAHVGRIHAVEAAASGVIVIAVSPEAESRLRNAVGSRQWEFVYEFVARTTAPGEPRAITCDLPVARHGSEPRVLVSHASGRKCETRFRPGQRFGSWTRWEARTHENRPHQVRLHAWESGLPIPGDSLYGRVPRVYLSQLKRRYRAGRDQERPLHPHLALHLREVLIPDGSGGCVGITAPPPKSYRALLRRLEESAGNAAPASLRL